MGYKNSEKFEWKKSGLNVAKARSKASEENRRGEQGFERIVEEETGKMDTEDEQESRGEVRGRGRRRWPQQAIKARGKSCNQSVVKDPSFDPGQFVV